MRRGAPLSALITGTVMILIVATTGVVGWSGYSGALETVDELGQQLADNLADQTTAQTLRFLEGAVPNAELSTALLEQGLLDPADPDALLAYLERSLDANERFSWISWGEASSGNFLGVYRQGAGQPMRRTRRSAIDDAHTLYVVEERGPDGWTIVERAAGARYDTRVRPWFMGAKDLPRGEGTWIDPYLFSERQQPGVTFSMPVRDRDDALVGVYGVDFEMAPMSAFLASLDGGRSSRAYVLTAEGLVVGHPSGELVRHTERGADFWPAAEHPDPILSGAWAASLAQEDRSRPFSFGEYLAVTTPFPPDSGIPWVVMTVVLRKDLLGHAEEQAVRSATFGVFAVIIALWLGMRLSRIIARSLDELRAELSRVARLDLYGAPVSRSMIREFNDMGQATEVMKQGLQAFARYVPQQLVRQLLKAGGEAKLGAERRELSVLFSDIGGFTTVVESTEPDVVLHSLGVYLDGMNEAIGAHKGTVCQYLGDGIMAVWGAPEPLVDHALRTCRGALAMQEHATALLAQSASTGAPRLPTRIGIDTGEVMVGNIGAHERFNYGVLGDTVNTAARLESLNKIYGTAIIVGERTVALVGDAMVFRTLDRVLLKGKRNPVLIYELMGASGAVAPALLQTRAVYEAALDHYFAGRFAEALSALGDCTDTPSCVLRDRCARFAAHPPAGWEGVFVLSEK